MNHRTLSPTVCDDSQYFAVNVSDEHDVQSHMFRPTITGIQDKCCGNCYDIYLVQSQCKGNQKRVAAGEGRRPPPLYIGGRRPQATTSLVVAAAGRYLCILALNKVNTVAVTTILVLHVGNGRSDHV